MSDSKKYRFSPNDPSSYSRPEVAKVVDIFLHLDADFDKHVLDGYAVLTVEKVESNAEHLILDTRNLTIHKVTDEADGQVLNYKMGEPEALGSKLEVELPRNSDKTLKIKIKYTTEKDCSALQWLPPSQTAGKKHPYMFSQNQAIHCRSMAPVQDTPSVKTTYTAEITVPSELMVVMSAVREGEPKAAPNDKRIHRFIQKIPIQSYLIAIAVGKLESRKIGPRSHVWSEIEYVDKAAFEFSETEEMLQKAEELCGPYVWGIYDILVLPPSFPYGGMENPCITFATPTLLAGDKSLANVIAHEIAHSWTGNLVTNSNFEHFWLNEGFTVFTERKINGLMKGKDSRDFSAIGGWKSLKYTVMEVLGKDNPLTALVVDLSGVDPDDAFSIVPYEKGSAFLWYLEESVGGPSKMEPFLRSYYDHFKFKSIDSNQFKEFFLNYFKDLKLDFIDWDAWFYSTGMPVVKPNYDESLAKTCNDLKDRWVSWKDDELDCPFKDSAEYDQLTTAQKIEFFSLLLEESAFSHKKLEKMNSLYKLDDVHNSEIRFRWIRLGLRGKWKSIIPSAIQMITEQGRMKFLRPIYRDLNAWDETKETAIDTFKKNKVNMMKVSVQGLEHDLKLSS